MDKWFPKDFTKDPFTELIQLKEEGLFHIHQSYEKRKDTNTAYCTKCGGNQFNVGCGSCYTAIKCVTCGWEALIHDG